MDKQRNNVSVAGWVFGYVERQPSGAWSGYCCRVGMGYGPFVTKDEARRWVIDTFDQNREIMRLNRESCSKAGPEMKALLKQLRANDRAVKAALNPSGLKPVAHRAKYSGARARSALPKMRKDIQAVLLGKNKDWAGATVRQKCGHLVVEHPNGARMVLERNWLGDGS